MARHLNKASPLLLLVAAALLCSVVAKKGVSEEGDPDCDKATGWEALEMPESDEGCVWDFFTAVWEFFEELPFKLRELWASLQPPPPPPPGMNEFGCMIGWAGKDCDECAPGFSGDMCDKKEL